MIGSESSCPCLLLIFVLRGCRNPKSAQLLARAWDASVLQRSDILTFIARDLKALLLEDDVSLLTQHVQGVLAGIANGPGTKASK